jgi:hypothetical protein
LIALQPTLALKYREMFPKHKKRGADGIDIELSDDDEEEDGEEAAGEVGAAKGAGVQRRRKSRVRSSDTSAASMALSNSNNNSNSGGGSSGGGSSAFDKRISNAANDPLRPALFDQKVTVEGEDGDDSLRCFQVRA